MADNKFLAKLHAEKTPKSVVEIKADKIVAPFADIPDSTAGDNIGITDDRDTALVVANGAKNWGLNGVNLFLTDNADFLFKTAVAGDGMWINASYEFPVSEDSEESTVAIVNPHSKWVLRLCGDNLFSENEYIPFTFVVKIGTSEIAHIETKAKRSANFFCKQFVVDFSKSASALIKAAAGDMLTVQLLCGDETASANIYNGKTVLTLLDRKINAAAVATDSTTFEDIITGVRKVEQEVKGIQEKIPDDASADNKMATANDIMDLRQDVDDNAADISALEADKVAKIEDAVTPVTQTNKVITQTEFKLLDDKINNAAMSGTNVGYFWFGKTDADFVAPNPTDDSQNYYDFTTNEIYAAKADLSGWDLQSTYTPPTDKDVNIRITSKFWNIPEQTGQQGGVAYWSYTDESWGYTPNIVSFDNANLTGVSTAPTPTADSPATQIATKEYVDLMSGGGKGDYCTTYGIIELPEDITTAATENILKIPAGIKMKTPAGRATIASATTYNVTSTSNFTLFYAASEGFLECGQVDYSKAMPADNGVDNYQAWWDGIQWRFKSVGSGNVWRTVNATPLCDCFFTGTNLTRIETVGYLWAPAPKDESGARLPLLISLWSDHILNDVSWLRADTFSWQDGGVYQAVYQHLVEDLSTAGAVQTETIAGIEISFEVAADGHRICLPTQESAVSQIYAKTGVAWFYILDTENARFKLPRSKHNKYAATVPVGGNGMTLGLTNGKNNYGLTSSNGLDADLDSYGTSASSSSGTGNLSNGYRVGITTDPEKSGIIAQQEQDTDQYKYLYFYVGNFTQTAIENTAGITAETLNQKADISAVPGLVIPDYSNPTVILDPTQSQLPTTEQTFVAPKDGVINIVLTGFNNAQSYLYINDVQIGQITTNGSSNTNSLTGQYLVPKNATIRVRTGYSGQVLGTQQAIFYPFIGA